MLESEQPARAPQGRQPGNSRGRRRSRHRRRRVVLSLTLIGTLVALGVLAYGALVVRQGSSQLQARLTVLLQTGQQQLIQGRGTLQLATSNRDVAVLGQAEQQFTAARASFQGARSLADGSTLLRRLEYAPIVGGQATTRHQAVVQLADMGSSLADAGTALAELDRTLMGTSEAASVGTQLLAALQQVGGGIEPGLTYLTRAASAAGAVDESVLSSDQQRTFRQTRTSIGQAIQGLQELRRLTPILTAILGGAGPRTYLVEQLNPAELRAGGGFIGSLSIVVADHGVFKVIKSGNAYADRATKGQPGYVAPPPQFAKLLGAKSWSLVDSNAFADFRSNAKWAEQFTQKDLQSTPDGVIALDPEAVAGILSVTGPVTVPGYGITVQAQGFSDQIYQLANGSQQVANHKDFLGALAGPLLDRISALPATGWPALLRVLNTAATGRHLQAYFNDPAAEEEMLRVGWGGTVNPGNAKDFFMEVESNLGASKSNHFLTRTYNVTVSQTPSALHHQVSVTLTHNTPPNQDEVGGNRNYYVYVRAYVPQDASNFVQHGLGPPDHQDQETPPGLQVVDGWVDVPVSQPGQGVSRQIVFDYDTPVPAGGSSLVWQKQPGTGNDQIHLTWRPQGGRSFQVDGHLSEDQRINFDSDGLRLAPAHPATAQLPSLNF